MYKTIKEQNTITFNKENIVINNKKVENIILKFNNNFFTMVEYNYKKQKSQSLIIFIDSCYPHTIYQINKYLKTMYY